MRAVPRHDATGRRSHGDHIAAPGGGLPGSDPIRGSDVDHGDAPFAAFRDPPFEVGERGGHFRIAGVAHPLTVILDGAHAAVARGSTSRSILRQTVRSTISEKST